MLEDLVNRQWQDLAQFLRGTKRLTPSKIRVFFVRKLRRKKPSLVVAIGKRGRVDALEEYRRRFASTADQGFREKQQGGDDAKQPERGEKAKRRQFEARGRRRDKRLKAKVNWSGGSSHLSGASWTFLVLALLRSYHAVARIRRKALIAVMMACAIALGGAYGYRTMMAGGDGLFRTNHIRQPSQSSKLHYDRLTADGVDTATAWPAAPSVSAGLAEPPSAGPDNRVGGPFPEGKQPGYVPATSQSVAAERRVTDQPTVVRSESYLPDGTRTDIARPAPVPSIVRLGAGPVRIPFLAAAKPPGAMAGGVALGTNSAPAAGPPVQPAAEPAPSLDSGYFAQVKADQDQNAAQAELAPFLDKYKAVLGEVPLITRSVDLKEKGIWFRVLAGPLKSRDEAASLCKKLKSAGLQACIIQKFD